MKLARFDRGDGARIGKVEGNTIVDLSAALPDIGSSMRAVLSNLDQFRPAIEAATQPAFGLDEVRLLAPIDDPQKYLAIGMNYEKHAQEAERLGVPRGNSQIWFNKQVSCITGPYDPIVKPAVSQKLDHECELAYVIGRRCRHVKAADALDYVAGYLVSNDVSARDWQAMSATVTIGKSFDTHGPLGPWITLTDEVESPYGLRIRTLVNGEERQSATTDDLIYDIGAQIEFLTTVMTLEPGDVIATGTPSGVGAATGNFLNVGDVVRVEIEGLGHIENVVTAG